MQNILVFFFIIEDGFTPNLKTLIPEKGWRYWNFAGNVVWYNLLTER